MGLYQSSNHGGLNLLTPPSSRKELDLFSTVAIRNGSGINDGVLGTEIEFGTEQTVSKEQTDQRSQAPALASNVPAREIHAPPHPIESLLHVLAVGGRLITVSLDVVTTLPSESLPFVYNQEDNQQPYVSCFNENISEKKVEDRENEDITPLLRHLVRRPGNDTRVASCSNMNVLSIDPSAKVMDDLLIVVLGVQSDWGEVQPGD
ncbi:Uncharacterized protein Fot_32002 [Forsythia ovata]|uniref:Uncharacterized protein n=1 Tax=Forsythia ovata TaxID=205694 RepID=A0ABD1T6Z2_9LAMI